MLVLALGVTSCSSKKKPVTPSSDSIPTSVTTSAPTSTEKPSSDATSDTPTSETTSVSDPTSDATTSETTTVDVPTSDTPITSNATVKIGSAEAVALKAMDPDPTIPNMTKQYSIEGVDVTAGDKIVFTIDGTVVAPGASGEGNNAKADASGLTIVSTATGVNIYLKAYDVWVTGYVPGDTPIPAGYEVTVNGTKATVGELTAGPTDAYACTVDLKKDDVLVISNNGTPLKVGETASTEFKCTVAGVHKVYVNDKGQVWVTEPLAPVETKYTITVNGTAKTITLIPDSENHAQFKLTLTKGDKVVVYGDGKALTGGAYSGTEYTVKATGEHTFYVNKDDVVYLNAPALDPSDVTSITVTVNFSKISEGNERYAAYLFGGSNNEWVSLEVNNGVATLTLTEAQAAKYTNIIFCRMNGAAAQNNWNNKWDQTADLTLEGNDGKTFTASSKSNGVINGSWN